MEFKQIYEQYWQRIFRLSLAYVNDPHWAKDLAQDTFITVWQQLPRFRNESSIGTWIFRIAVNTCLRQMEKEKRLSRSELDRDVPDAGPVDLEDKTLFLYTCIAELPETDRLIISLELEDLKQAEIAEIVGISEANVRVRIHRIKEKLTQKFKSYEH